MPNLSIHGYGDNLTINNSRLGDLSPAEHEKIDMRKDIFNRKISYRKLQLDDSFPKYIVNNKEKLKEWII